jgi:RNA 2',3'-cyclic 3'-phosphodiesterase
VRSFLSLNIDGVIQLKLKQAQDDARKILSSHTIKWERYEKFHLTLFFLGEISEKIVDDIIKELGSIKLDFRNIRMRTGGIGFFPNRRRPNVIFIDLKEKDGTSERLTDEIDKAVEKFGFKRDKKFVPHITWGRFRRDHRTKISEEININIEPIEITFDSFYLMKSITKPSGSVYEVIQRFKF